MANIEARNRLVFAWELRLCSPNSFAVVFVGDDKGSPLRLIRSEPSKHEPLPSPARFKKTRGERVENIWRA